MSDSPKNSTRTSPISRLFGCLVRLLFVLVVGALLGGALYYGASLLYNQYVQAVQENKLQLEALQASQEQANQLTSQRIDELVSRLERLELQGDQHKNSLTTLEERLATLEAAHEESQAKMEGLSDAQATLTAGLANVEDALERFRSSLDALDVEVATLQAQVDDLADAAAKSDLELQTISSASKESVKQVQNMQRELVLLRAMELLTRGRYYLAQGNLSLAKADLQASRDLLVALLEEAPSSQVEAIEASLELIKQAIANLPLYPVTAADKLEGAWELLIAGLPVATATPESEVVPTTPIPPAALTPTPTPTP